MVAIAFEVGSFAICGGEQSHRPSLLLTLQKHLNNGSRSLRTKSFYIQINLGDEPQKTGIPSAQAEPFIEYCLLNAVPIKGLMAIPPKDKNPVPYFKRLRHLVDQYSLQACVMGMSTDYEVAIDYGTTHLRIGRTIWG